MVAIMQALDVRLASKQSETGRTTQDSHAANGKESYHKDFGPSRHLQRFKPWHRSNQESNIVDNVNGGKSIT
jgi:hypothetical protein